MKSMVKRLLVLSCFIYLLAVIKPVDVWAENQKVSDKLVEANSDRDEEVLVEDVSVSDREPLIIESDIQTTRCMQNG